MNGEVMNRKVLGHTSHSCSAKNYGYGGSNLGGKQIYGLIH